MRVTLVAKASSRAKLEKALDDISFRIQLLAEHGWGVAWDVWEAAIYNIFGQGGPGWERLSEVTAQEREAQGFDPYEPILIRAGHLMDSLVSLDNPRHSVTYRPTEDAFMDDPDDPNPAPSGMTYSVTTGSVSGLRVSSPGSSVFRFGTQDERFRTLQKGAPQRNLPARPMLPEGETEAAMTREMARRMVGVLVAGGKERRRGR